MRVSALAVAPLLALLVGCSTAHADPTSQRDDGITSENPIGLRLTYDEGSSTVRATFEEPLADGERLVLRLRRGRLSVEAQTELNCAQLATAAELPGPGRVYQGPTIDVALLATVYNATWIRDHISPAVLDALASDGADSIVEACIMQGVSVKSRLRTTAIFAWDPTDPNLSHE